jgi:heme exporter protein CcmD
MMPHAPFIIASYAVTGIGMTWLVISSYLSMRRAEASADALKERS